jgi:hypothetical protein
MSLLKKRRPKPKRQVARGLDCPFCKGQTPSPRPVFEVFSGDTVLGGACGCGAGFVIDETGKAGGQTLLDALAMACKGDLDLALSLDSSRDYKVNKHAYNGSANTLGVRQASSSYVRPKVWFVKLTGDSAE